MCFHLLKGQVSKSSDFKFLIVKFSNSTMSKLYNFKTQSFQTLVFSKHVMLGSSIASDFQVSKSPKVPPLLFLKLRTENRTSSLGTCGTPIVQPVWFLDFGDLQNAGVLTVCWGCLVFVLTILHQKKGAHMQVVRQTPNNFRIKQMISRKLN